MPLHFFKIQNGWAFKTTEVWFRDDGKPFTCRHFQAIGRGETTRKKGIVADLLLEGLKLLRNIWWKLLLTRKQLTIPMSQKFSKRISASITDVLISPRPLLSKRTHCWKLSKEFLPAKSSTAVVMNEVSYFPFKHLEMLVSIPLTKRIYHPI